MANSPRKPSWLVLLAILALSGNKEVEAFTTSLTSSSATTSCKVASSVAPSTTASLGRRRFSTITLQSQSTTNNDDAADTTDATSAAEMTELEASQKREIPKLTPEDTSFVSSLFAACGGGSDTPDTAAMEDAITANLDKISPGLIVALQIAADKGEWKEEENDNDEEFESQMVTIGNALSNVLNVRLKSGRELLADLLKSGEIRKLDSTIGKAAKDGKLDMSFFSVLGMNMRDAAMGNGAEGGDGEESSISLSPTLAAGEGQEEVEGEEGQPATANRLQILQHIYTRCQEELEKTVAPGVGLLNKLLRTEISSIRSNQLEYYLGPQRTEVTSPDGKTISLPGSSKPLVSTDEFIGALSNAVTQIRTLEAAGGTDRLSAMNLLESIRQVAMEARVVLVECYGEGSEIVGEFQQNLQPVFRPGSNL